MKEIGIDELKRLQLDMLVVIDKYCRTNSIRYTLAYGTLIGAIRHKGYIPWDDDIDIAMPRPDYDKFLKGFNGFDTHLNVIAPEIDSNYYAPYANVFDKRTLLIEKNNSHRGYDIGVKIDVFPVDAAPEDFANYQNVVKQIRRKNDLLMIKRRPFFPVSNYKVFIMRLITYVISMFYTYGKLQKQIIRIATRRPYDKTKYVDTLTYPAYDNTRVLRDYFENYIDVDFEGRVFKSTKYYDELLHQIYGDYMKLPPLDKQVPHHGFTAYWRD